MISVLPNVNDEVGGYSLLSIFEVSSVRDLLRVSSNVNILHYSNCSRVQLPFNP